METSMKKIFSTVALLTFAFALLMHAELFANETVSMDTIRQCSKVTAIFQLTGFKFNFTNPMIREVKNITRYLSLASLNAGNVTLRDIKPESISVENNVIQFKHVPDSYLSKDEYIVSAKFSPDMKEIEELTVSRASSDDEGHKNFLWKVKSLKGGEIVPDAWKSGKEITYKNEFPFNQLSENVLEMQYSEKSPQKILDYAGFATEEEMKEKVSADDLFNMTRPSVSITFSLKP